MDNKKRCLAQLVLTCIFLFTTVQTALGKTNTMPNTLTWRSALRALPPGIPASISFNDEYITALSRGRSFSLYPKSEYTGIGIYRMPLTDDKKEKLKEIEHVLTDNKWPTSSRSMSLQFSIDKNNKTYNGAYEYNGSDEQDDIILMADDIYKDVLKHGKPITSFYPSLNFSAAPKGFDVVLHLKNIGETPITIAGPSHWEMAERAFAEPHVKVFSGSGDTAFYMLLGPSNYIGPQKYDDQIILPAKETIDIGFFVPYKDVIYQQYSKDGIIMPGNYSLQGRMKASILAPEKISGLVNTFIEYHDNSPLKISEKHGN